jgi:tRNA(fMet)-specific endonuclease VapC
LNFLLDTNAVIALINGEPKTVRARFDEAAKSGAQFLLSSVAYFELRYGVERSARKEENAAALEAFLAGDIDMLPFGQGDAVTGGKLRATLSSRGTAIGPYDLLLAAQALRSQSTLVTANLREFSRVEGLKIENWAAPARRR